MKAGLLCLAVPLLWAQNGAVVEGTAFNRLTHAAVSGVAVKLAATGSAAPAAYSATSDAAGAFRIEGLKDGDYAASFEAPRGYLGPRRGDPSLIPFHVAADSDPVKLAVPLMPLGSLRGRVLLPDGHAAARVRVELFSAHDLSGHILTTDGEGRFFQDGLIPGAYHLRARPVLSGTPLGRKPENLSSLPEKLREGERWIWAPTYYPNAIEKSGAETIVVREGAELAGYDIWLRAAPVYRLRGTVLDNIGKPAAGVPVWLLPEIGWGAGEAMVTSGDDGRFEFPAVRAGDWHVTADGKRGDIKWMGFTNLAMPQHDVEDVTVRIDPPFSLDGAVEGMPAASDAKSRLIVRLEPVAGSLEQESTARVRPDGTFQLENIYPGRYRVAIHKEASGPYLKAILLGPRDVTGQDVEVVPNSPPLRVILKGNGARVRGQVEGGAGAVVLLVETDEAHAVGGDSLRVAGCDRNGRYSIEGLRPGAYFLLATAIAGNVNTDAVKEMIFTRGLSRQAQTVHLEEGETLAVDLKLVLWPE